MITTSCHPAITAGNSHRKHQYVEALELHITSGVAKGGHMSLGAGHRGALDDRGENFWQGSMSTKVQKRLQSQKSDAVNKAF